MDTTSHTNKTIGHIDDMLKAGELRISHHAYKSGYVSRKIAGIVREYHGKFGNGYVIDTPLHSTTRYFNRTYYLTTQP
jgi:hypothetical protein